MITNTFCYTRINATGQVEVNIKEVYTQAEWLHNFVRSNIASNVWSTVKEVLLNLTWFLPFQGPLMAIGVLFLFGPHWYNFLVKFCLLCCAKHFSHVQLCVTLWTVARHDPLSMGFSRQEYWSGLPVPSPGDFPDPGIELVSLTSNLH